MALLRLVARRLQRPTGAARLRYRLVRVACLVNLVFLVGFPVLFSLVAADLLSLTDAIDPWLRLLQLCSLVGLAGTGLAAYETGTARSWLGRLNNGALVLAGVSRCPGSGSPSICSAGT